MRALREVSNNTIGNWRKGESCYVAAECLATLSPAFMGKAENAPNGLKNEAKRFLARVLEVMPSFFLLGMVK